MKPEYLKMNQPPAYAYEQKDWPEIFSVSFCSASSKSSTQQIQFQIK